MKQLKIFFCSVACVGYMHQVHAQYRESAVKDGFILSGSAGVSGSIYTSNEPVSSRQHFSWNTYGNFALSKRDLSIPVTFIMSQFGNGRTTAFSQFGLSPVYKWITLHLGDRYMDFSPFVFQGQSFRGAGIELKPGKFRFAAFYGKLRKAVNDTSQWSVNYTGWKYPSLQYEQRGYGAKVGFGNAANHFDLIFFHAKDDSTSASVLHVRDETKKDSLRRLVPARENAVVGSSFRLRFFRRVYLAGDIALSGLTADLSADSISRKFIETNFLDRSPFLESLYKSGGSRLLKLNRSTFLSYAGQSSVSFSSRYVNSSLNYRRVAPDFISLGTPYLVNDLEQASWFNYISAVKGRLTVSTSLTTQHNNLSKKQNTELNALTGMVNINTMLSRHCNVNVNYSQYKIIPKEGIVPVPDSNKIRQQISQISLNPSYNFTKGVTQQLVSASINLSDLHDKITGHSLHRSSINRNLAASLSYMLGLMNKPLNFSFISTFNTYTNDSGSYRSYGATASAAVQFLKQRNLNVQGSIGGFLNHYSSDITHNITYALHVSYLSKHHSFGMYGNCIFTPYNKVQNVINMINRNYSSAVATRNLAAGISYTYTF